MSPDDRQIPLLPDPLIPLKEKNEGINGRGLDCPPSVSVASGMVGSNGNHRESTGRAETSPQPSAAPSRRAVEAVLALDLGTATGWALRVADGMIASGTQSFKPGRFDGGGMRYLRLRAWLAELQTTAGPLTAIYFEEVRRHSGVDAAHVYGGLMATLTAWCEAERIPYAGVPVGTIKRHATGKGNADKDAVIAAMRALGYAPGDDNEADALALLTWALAQSQSGSAVDHKPQGVAS